MKIKVKDCEEAVRCYWYKGQMHIIDDYALASPW